MPFRWPWFRKRPCVILDEMIVTMYTRQGCHLCERAWEELSRARAKYGFRLESIGIGTDAVLESRFKNEIPVVLINGKLRFRGVIQPALLERLLHAEARRKTRSRRRD